MEVRAQVAYHVKIDPAKLIPGRIQLPEQITRTVSVGEEILTEKISILALPAADRTSLEQMLDAQCREATRTARPAGVAAAEKEPVLEQDEVSAF